MTERIPRLPTVASLCVARMRFVIKDNCCVLCKTELPTIYFTRFNGDYTTRLAPEDFPKLKAGPGHGAFLAHA